MTAKEKAIKLVNEFDNTLEYLTPRRFPKQCALTCVEEILSVLNRCTSNLITHQVKSEISYYWEVKREIGKL